MYLKGILPLNGLWVVIFVKDLIFLADFALVLLCMGGYLKFIFLQFSAGCFLVSFHCM